MDNANNDDIIPGDGTGANPPARLTSLHPRCLLCPDCQPSAPPNHCEKAHVYEPAHRTRNSLRKFLNRDRVVRWGLVPRHDLAVPFAVSGPLMVVLRQHIKLRLGTRRACAPGGWEIRHSH